MPPKSEKLLYKEFIDKEARRMMKGNPSLAKTWAENLRIHKEMATAEYPFKGKNKPWRPGQTPTGQTARSGGSKKNARKRPPAIIPPEKPSGPGSVSPNKAIVPRQSSALAKNEESLLKKLVGNKKVPKGFWAGAGRLLGMGFNVWMVYSIMDMAGLLGRKGQQDRNLSAAMASFGPQWAGKAGQAHDFQAKVADQGFMTDMSNFAQAKQRGSRDIGKVLSRELDGLLAGKEGLMASASEMSPITQRAYGQVAGML